MERCVTASARRDNKDPGSKRMTTLHPTTSHKLAAFARRRRVLLVMRGLCALGVTLLGTMTGVAMLDRFVVLPDWLRLALSVIAYAAAAAVFWFVCLKPLLRRQRKEDAAQQMGAAAPQLGDDVISAVELGRADGDARLDSPVFRDLLQQSVAGRVTSLRVAPLLPWRLIAGWLASAVVVLALMAILSAIPGLGFPRMMARAMAPPANLDRVSTTVIKLVEPAKPDAPVPQGDAVTIVAEARGGEVNGATLRVIREGEPDAEIKMEATNEPGQFREVLPIGREATAYRIEAGDGVTRKFTVNAKPRPSVLKFTKSYTFPAYTKLAPKAVTEDTGDLAAVEGSSVELGIVPDQAIKSGVIETEIDGKVATLPLRRAAGVGGEHQADWAATMPMNATGTYRVKLVAAETGFENTFSPTYEIRALPDLRPSVQIDEPARGAAAAANATLRLRGAARDDFSLASVERAVRVNEGEWQSSNLSKDPGQELTIDAPLPLGELKLSPGDLVTVKLTATDTKGNLGESEPVQIRIAAEGETEAAAQASDAASLATQLGALAGEAKELQNQSAALAAQAQQAGDAPKTGEQAAALGEKQAAFDRKLEAAKDALRQNANEQDLLSKEGREAARDADGAVAMLKQPNPSAGDALAKAAQAKAGGEQAKSLNDAATKQGQMASALEQAAKHYENAAAGKASESRPAMRAGEQNAGVKEKLDAEYAQVEKVAEMARMSPAELKAALETELPKNAGMQRELGEIAKETLQQAHGDLQRAAAQEKQLADAMQGSNPPSPAAAAEKQPAIREAVENAADDIARAAMDAQRLNQNEQAKALREAADKTEGVAAQDIPRAEQALTKGESSAAAPAVNEAAEAIQARAEAVGKEMGSAKPQATPAAQGDAASPPKSQDAAKNPEGNQSNPTASPSSNNQAVPSAKDPSAPGANQSSPPKGSQQAPSPGGESPKGSQPSATKSGEPASAAAKLAESSAGWMASALDHLDQAEQQTRRDAARQASSPTQAANSASSPPGQGAPSQGTPAANGESSAQPSQGAGPANGATPSQGESQGSAAQGESGTPGAASGQSPTPGQSASTSQGEAAGAQGQGAGPTPGSASGQAAAPSSAQGQSQGASSASASPASNQTQGQSGSTGSGESSSSMASAAEAMQSAAAAQAQAMRDGRMAESSSRSGGASNSSAYDTQRANDAAARSSSDVPGANAAAGAGLDWGKLTPEQARDLITRPREELPPEYRDKVEAYYRAIAEQAHQGGRPPK